MSVCVICNQPATNLCGGCQNRVYCNRACQKLDWKKGHRNKCMPYQVEMRENRREIQLGLGFQLGSIGRFMTTKISGLNKVNISVMNGMCLYGSEGLGISKEKCFRIVRDKLICSPKHTTVKQFEDMVNIPHDLHYMDRLNSAAWRVLIIQDIFINVLIIRDIFMNSSYYYQQNGCFQNEPYEAEKSLFPAMTTIIYFSLYSLQKIPAFRAVRKNLFYRIGNAVGLKDSNYQYCSYMCGYCGKNATKIKDPKAKKITYTGKCCAHCKQYYGIRLPYCSNQCAKLDKEEHATVHLIFDEYIGRHNGNGKK